MTLGRVVTLLVTPGITRLEHNKKYKLGDLHCGYNLQHDTLAKLWLHFLGTVLVTSCTYVLIYVLDLKTETAVATSKKQFRCKNWELDVHSRNDVSTQNRI